MPKAQQEYRVLKVQQVLKAFKAQPEYKEPKVQQEYKVLKEHKV